MSALSGRSTTPAAPSASFPSAGLAGRRVRSLIHASLVVNSRRLRISTSGPHLLACYSQNKLRSRQLCGWSRSRIRVRYVRLAPGHFGAWIACTEVRRLEDSSMVTSFPCGTQAPNRLFCFGAYVLTIPVLLGCRCSTSRAPRHKMTDRPAGGDQFKRASSCRTMSSVSCTSSASGASGHSLR